MFAYALSNRFPLLLALPPSLLPAAALFTARFAVFFADLPANASAGLLANFRVGLPADLLAGLAATWLPSLKKRLTSVSRKNRNSPGLIFSSFKKPIAMRRNLTTEWPMESNILRIC